MITFIAQQTGGSGRAVCSALELPRSSFYHAAAPTPTQSAARVAGHRWAIEESFAQSKSEAGLDQYEVRSWTNWHWHMTLVMVTQALLAITRADSSPSRWRAREDATKMLKAMRHMVGSLFAEQPAAAQAVAELPPD